jgi:YspA, cpYpsA-related SLOG family
MRVLVCGGRDFDERELVWRTLDQYQENYGPLTVIQGGAPGADCWAREWAYGQTPVREVTLVSVPADWEKWGSAAGPQRNHLMLDQKPDVVLAFPGGRGTADMIARAEQAGVEIVKVGWTA